MRSTAAAAWPSASHVKLKRLAVVRRGEEVAAGCRRSALGQHLRHGQEVALAFGHRLLVDEQVRDVEPMAHEGLAVRRPLWAISFSWWGRSGRCRRSGCRRSRPGTFMPIRGALEVPAGSPGPNGASHWAQPGSSLLSFHSTKFARVLLLVAVVVDARARLDAETSSRDSCPYSGKLAMRNRCCLRRIGVAVAVSAHERDHRGMWSVAPREVLGPLEPQCRHVLPKTGSTAP